MYEREFDAIHAAQAPHHSIRPEQWAELRKLIFFQRPLRPVEPGPCLLEDGESRAPKALPAAQEFRMVQEVNNLRLQRDPGGPEEPLTREDRDRVLDYLRNHKEIKFDRMRTLLRLPQARITLEQWGRKGLKGDETAARLSDKDIFGRRWWTFSAEERTRIVKVLLESEDPEIIQRRAHDEWGLDDQAAANAAKIHLPDGHVNLSEKAIEKVLPHLLGEPGLSWAEAAQRAGYHHSDFRSGEAHDALPYYGAVLPKEVAGALEDPPAGDEPARWGRIANPTVHIALNQLRRVVNRLILAYGKPERIVVELARDLKLNREERDRLKKENQEGADRNDRLRKDIENAEQQVTAEALLKLRLWEEQGPPQGRNCPYTGKTLSFEMALSAATEVDHILPLSRTWDDSPANKVLCLAEANREKGDRTPYEAFGSDKARYQEMLSRIESLRPNKRWRFQPDALQRYEKQGGFLDRQLNETMYLSRIARQYLACLYDEKGARRNFVSVTPGRLTANLRRGWGLHNVLVEKEEGEGEKTGKKVRDDHRHHAIDAFVVACTSRSLLQAISRAAGKGDDKRIAELAEEAAPWPGFSRNDLALFLDRMVVSHKPDHGTAGTKGKTTGQLHDATAHGLVGFKKGEKAAGKQPASIMEAQTVVRKRLETFKSADLEDIRDEALRKALQALWSEVARETGTKDGDAAAFARRAREQGVQLGSRVFKVRSVRLLDKKATRVVAVYDASGKPYKGYAPGSNAFADLWEMPAWPYTLKDGERKPRGIHAGERQWQMTVVSTFEANQPGFDAATTRPHPAARHIARLHSGDMCALDADGKRCIYRVRKIDAGGTIHIDPHNEANTDSRIRRKQFKDIKKSAEQLRKEGFRRVRVDEIGRAADPSLRGGRRS